MTKKRVLWIIFILFLATGRLYFYVSDLFNISGEWIDQALYDWEEDYQPEKTKP